MAMLFLEALCRLRYQTMSPSLQLREQLKMAHLQLYYNTTQYSSIPTLLPHLFPYSSSEIVLQIQYKNNVQMSRSLPKPKIIFKSLQDLIQSSELSRKQPVNTVDRFSSHTLPLRSVTQTSIQSLKHSNSKQSVQSKGKTNSCIKNNNRTSFFKEGKPSISITYEGIEGEITKVYDQMESYLLQSKARVLSQLKEENRSSNIDNKIKQLEKMSDYLKHIIEVFTNQNSQVLLNQRKVLKESSKQNENLERLSKNQKKKANCRYVQTGTQKEPSIYERLLSRLG